MKRVFSGLTVLAAAMIAPAAIAGPQDADLWIGLANGEDGFLIDQSSGDTWMTGICLKSLATAVNTGSIWQSRTAEMVSVGRIEALLDQTFTLDVNPAAPTIKVENAVRGGAQSFPAMIVEDCQSSATCRVLLDAPAC